MLTNQTILNTREIKLNEFQVHVNWEIFNTKLIPGITFTFVALIHIDMSLEPSTFSTFTAPRFNRS